MGCANAELCHGRHAGLWSAKSQEALGWLRFEPPITWTPGDRSPGVPVETGEVLWMKVPCGEGLATRPGPRVMRPIVREARGEALTGVRAGRVLSREIDPRRDKRRQLRGADALGTGGRPHLMRRQRKTRQDPARSETPRMHGCTSHGNREVPRLSVAEGATGRIGKSKDARR